MKLEEGKACIDVPVADTVSKKLPVFYNPAMTLNRDIAVLLIRALGKKHMRLADILAGSGVRAIRFLKELPAGTVEEMLVNDAKPTFKKDLAHNLKLSKCAAKRLVVEQEDANFVWHDKGGYDYIDIDPFGSPAPFLDAAIRHLSRDGVLALTATDTAALAGTAMDACRRKYWALPMRNHLMHEVGMRILARKAQLVAAQYDRALIPIYCHSTLHYTRLYLRSLKSKEAVSGVQDLHRYLIYDPRKDEVRISDHNAKKRHELVAGPLWSGPLWDPALARKIATYPSSGDTAKLTETLAIEAAIPVIGFYDIHQVAGKLKVNAPSFERLIKVLRKEGFVAARTHFSPSGLRTDADASALRKILKTLS